MKLNAKELNKAPMANHIYPSQTLQDRLIDFFLITLRIAYFTYQTCEQILIIKNILLQNILYQ